MQFLFLKIVINEPKLFKTIKDEMDGITDLTDMNLGKLWEIARDREAWPAAVHGAAKRHDLATEQQEFYTGSN